MSAKSEERIKNLEMEVHALHKVIFTWISWSMKDLGEQGIRQLSEIYHNERERKKDGI